MKRISRRKKVFGALLCILALGAITVAIGEGAGPFTDRIDPVLMEGGALPAPILGAPTANYGLFVIEGGKPAPIPFQIDEFDDKGEILAQKGQKPRPDTDKGAFDKNDLLVFMSFDAGAKAAAKPAVPGCDTVAEISVGDGKASGFAYLAKCAQPPAKSSKKYVQWDAAKRTASTERYKMGWQLGANFHYDYMSIYNGPDILDRLKLRVHVLMLTFNEEKNFTNNIQGYIDGPVRAAYINLPKVGLGSFGAVPNPQYVYFYRDFVYLHNLLDTRATSALIGIETKIGISHDLQLDRAKGYKICANVIPNCDAVDGKMTPERIALSQKQLSWGGIEGPEGALITKLIIDPKLPAKSMGIYADDPKKTNGPENIPGSNPEIGFLVIDLKSAKAGVYYLDFYHYFMKKYSKAEFDRLDRMTAAPLKSKAAAM